MHSSAVLLVDCRWSGVHVLPPVTVSSESSTSFTTLSASHTAVTSTVWSDALTARASLKDVWARSNSTDTWWAHITHRHTSHITQCHVKRTTSFLRNSSLSTLSCADSSLCTNTNTQSHTHTHPSHTYIHTLTHHTHTYTHSPIAHTLTHHTHPSHTHTHTHTHSHITLTHTHALKHTHTHSHITHTLTECTFSSSTSSERLAIANSSSCTTTFVDTRSNTVMQGVGILGEIWTTNKTLI